MSQKKKKKKSAKKELPWYLKPMAEVSAIVRDNLVQMKEAADDNRPRIARTEDPEENQKEVNPFGKKGSEWLQQRRQGMKGVSLPTDKPQEGDSSTRGRRVDYSIGTGEKPKWAKGASRSKMKTTKAHEHPGLGDVPFADRLAKIKPFKQIDVSKLANDPTAPGEEQGENEKPEDYAERLLRRPFNQIAVDAALAPDAPLRPQSEKIYGSMAAQGHQDADAVAQKLAKQIRYGIDIESWLPQGSKNSFVQQKYRRIADAAHGKVQSLIKDFLLSSDKKKNMGDLTRKIMDAYGVPDLLAYARANGLEKDSDFGAKKTFARIMKTLDGLDTMRTADVAAAKHAGDISGFSNVDKRDAVQGILKKYLTADKWKSAHRDTDDDSPVDDDDSPPELDSAGKIAVEEIAQILNLPEAEKGRLEELILRLQDDGSVEMIKGLLDKYAAKSEVPSITGAREKGEYGKAAIATHLKNMRDQKGLTSDAAAKYFYDDVVSGMNIVDLRRMAGDLSDDQIFNNAVEKTPELRKHISRIEDKVRSAVMDKVSDQILTSDKFQNDVLLMSMKKIPEEQIVAAIVKKNPQIQKKIEAAVTEDAAELLQDLRQEIVEDYESKLVHRANAVTAAKRKAREAEKAQTASARDELDPELPPKVLPPLQKPRTEDADDGPTLSPEEVATAKKQFALIQAYPNLVSKLTGIPRSQKWDQSMLKKHAPVFEKILDMTSDVDHEKMRRLGLNPGDRVEKHQKVLRDLTSQIAWYDKRIEVLNDKLQGARGSAEAEKSGILKKYRDKIKSYYDISRELNQLKRSISEKEAATGAEVSAIPGAKARAEKDTMSVMDMVNRLASATKLDDDSAKYAASLDDEFKSDRKKDLKADDKDFEEDPIGNIQRAIGRISDPDVRSQVSANYANQLKAFNKLQTMIANPDFDMSRPSEEERKERKQSMRASTKRLPTSSHDLPGDWQPHRKVSSDEMKKMKLSLGSRIDKLEKDLESNPELRSDPLSAIKQEPIFDDEKRASIFYGAGGGEQGEEALRKAYREDFEDTIDDRKDAPSKFSYNFGDLDVEHPDDFANAVDRNDSARQIKRANLVARELANLQGDDRKAKTHHDEPLKLDKPKKNAKKKSDEPELSPRQLINLKKNRKKTIKTSDERTSTERKKKKEAQNESISISELLLGMKGGRRG